MPTEYGQTGLHGVLVPLPVALATKQGQGHALLPLMWQGEGTVLVQRRNPTNVIPGLVQLMVYGPLGIPGIRVRSHVTQELGSERVTVLSLTTLFTEHSVWV